MNHRFTALAFMAATLIVSDAHAQDRSRHADTWNFGQKCRMKWTADASSFAFTVDPSIATNEGCASFSNPTTGDLLLYTDGITVWRGTDGLAIATGLPGNPSSLHSGVIVPVPGSPGDVYVLGHTAGASSAVGYQRFDLNSTPVAEGSASSVSLPASTGREGMLVIPHTNGIDYWVLVDGVSMVYVLPITATGIGAPVATDANISIWSNGWSLFAASHQGDKVIVSGNSSTGTDTAGNVQMFDFDRSTGALSNRTLINASFRRSEFYGGVFSPNGKRFYFATLTDGGVGRYYQYDLETQTYTQLGVGNQPYYFGDGRLAPDGRIYIAGDRANSIHMITNPDAFCGPSSNNACGFVANAYAPPAGCAVDLGLPQTPSPIIDVQLNLSVNILQPTDVVTGTTTTISGSANAPNGATVTVTIVGPDGATQTCTGTVTNAAWACTGAGSQVDTATLGAYAVTAIVSSSNQFAQDESAFCSTAGGPDVCVEICDSERDDDLNGLVDIYDPSCQPGDPSCTVPVTPATFSIREANRTTDDYEDLFWPITADIDADGQTEILAANFTEKRIDVLDGRTLALESFIPVDGDRGDVFATANLDADPQLEVATIIHQRVGGTLSNRMIVADLQGTTWKVNIVSTDATQAANNCAGNVGSGLGIGFADFDGNGKPEIFYGNEVYTYNDDLSQGCVGCVQKILDGDDSVADSMHGCLPAVTTAEGAGPQGMVSVVADVLDAAACGGSHDCDGPELVVAGHVFSIDIANSRITRQRNVNAFGQTGYGDGFTAVADLDADGDLDVAVAGNAPGGSTLYAYDPLHSTVIKRWTMTGSTGHGYSPITIADVYDEDLADDGNTNNSSVGNLPELIVTRRRLDQQPVRGDLHALNVSSTTPIWTLATTDNSGSTSTTVFDFNGDGVLELAYRDVSEMRVMYGGPLAYAPAGVDATTRNYTAISCVSQTMNEGPTVADVDDDGAAELIVLCGNGPATLTVFESAGAPWREARHVWNQPMFAPGSVDEHGEIYPVAQERNSYIPEGSTNRPLNVAIAQNSPLEYRGRTNGLVTAIDAVISDVHLRAEDCGNTFDKQFEFTVTNAGDAPITGALEVRIVSSNPGSETVRLEQLTLTNGALPITAGQSATFMAFMGGNPSFINFTLNPDAVVPECRGATGNGGGTDQCETCGAEACNGIDDNCDGSVDEGCDDDEDGFCDGTMGCDPETIGELCPNGCGDCNDFDGGSNPNGFEICDDQDNDCDESTDEGCDDDDDGYCDNSIGCGEGLPETCPNGCSDCNDDDPEAFPEAVERCNGQDDDCNETIDNDVPGVGEPCDGEDEDFCSDGTVECVFLAIPLKLPHGIPHALPLAEMICVEEGPGNVEVCNGIDDDCDEGRDEGCDDDEDGWCDADMECSTEGGDIAACPNGCGDCDDDEGNTFPGNAEVCDGIDNNCVGSGDSGVAPVPTTCGVGACTNSGVIVCQGGELVTQCTPLQPAANDALCNGVDDDCSGGTDEDYVPRTITCGTICQIGGVTSCVQGKENVPECTATGNGQPCASNNQCASANACKDGVCAATSIKSCSDGNPCTVDSCNPLTGCVYEDAENETECSDGTECTQGDRCEDGQCVGVGVSCEAPRECERPGECNIATGVCDYDFVEGCTVCGDDQTPPTLVCPTPVTDALCSAGGAEVELGNASGRDECSDVTITNDAPGVYPPGTTLVTFTGSDAAGNTATCTTSVVVSDEEPPVINCPERTEVQGDPGTCGAIVTLEPTAIDDCDGSEVTFVGVAVDGAFFPPGPTTTVVAAIDAAGNQSVCETVIDVVGLDDFSIDCEDEVQVEAPDDYCGWPDTLTAQVYDQCRTVVEIESETDGFPIGASDVTFEADRGDGPLTCVTHLVVTDATAPTVNCGFGAKVDLVTTFVPTAEDACAATLTIDSATCERQVGEATTAVSERCDVQIRDGVSVVVNDAPKSEDGAIFIVYSGVAVDPSGNETEFTCKAPVDPESLDHDHDTIPDRDDNCPDVPNTNQLDQNDDGVGDACQDVPFEGLKAEGSGGCTGGATSLFALVALAFMRRRRK